MITLLDTNYEDSNVKMDIIIKRREKLEALIQYDIQISFDFNFTTIGSNIVWTQEDISTLKDQICNISSKSTFGILSPIEPELIFMYMKESEESEELSLYITMDSGHINSNIGTETGPTLKLITTKNDLINWINDIERTT